MRIDKTLAGREGDGDLKKKRHRELVPKNKPQTANKGVNEKKQTM